MNQDLRGEVKVSCGPTLAWHLPTGSGHETQADWPIRNSCINFPATFPVDFWLSSNTHCDSSLKPIEASDHRCHNPNQSSSPAAELCSQIAAAYYTNFSPPSLRCSSSSTPTPPACHKYTPCPTTKSRPNSAK